MGSTGASAVVLKSVTLWIRAKADFKTMSHIGKTRVCWCPCRSEASLEVDPWRDEPSNRDTRPVCGAGAELW